MKNIWLFNQYATTPNHIGSTRHFDIAHKLIKKGHTVTIFCSSFVHYKYYDVIQNYALSYKEMYEGINFIHLKAPGYSNNGVRRMLNMAVFAIHLFVQALLHALKNKRPDVIYSSTPHLFTPLVGCILSKLLRVRHVMEVRDLWPETFILFGKLKRNSLLANALFAIEKFCYSKSDEIITTLPGAHHYMIKRGVDGSKIHHIANGVDLAKFDENISKYNVCDQLDLSPHKGKFTVCYTGAHGLANNLDLMLDLAISLKKTDYADKIHFLLIGEGTEKKRLQERVLSERINNVFFFSAVNKNYIPSLLSKCDCQLAILRACELYKKYGLSLNKLNDYFAASKPIILYGTSYNDVVADSNSGTTVSDSNGDPVSALRQALIALYNMPKRQRERLGSNARSYAEKFHDINLLAKKVEYVLFPDTKSVQTIK